MNATIYEAGNGFPSVGDYVQCDGELYEIESVGSHISTHQPGIGNSISAELSPADWDDCLEGDEFPARVELSVQDELPAQDDDDDDDDDEYIDADGDCRECGHPANNSSGHGTCDSPAHR